MYWYNSFLYTLYMHIRLCSENVFFIRFDASIAGKEVRILKNMTNHPISGNIHPPATGNKAIHSLKRGVGIHNKREHHKILTKYETVHPAAVSENASLTGLLIVKTVNRTVCINIYLKRPNNQHHSK